MKTSRRSGRSVSFSGEIFVGFGESFFPSLAARGWWDGDGCFGTGSVSVLSTWKMDVGESGTADKTDGVDEELK